VYFFSDMPKRHSRAGAEKKYTRILYDRINDEVRKAEEPLKDKIKELCGHGWMPSDLKSSKPVDTQ